MSGFIALTRSNRSNSRHLTAFFTVMTVKPMLDLWIFIFPYMGHLMVLRHEKCNLLFRHLCIHVFG